jgi:hypothetical protein
LLHVLWRLGTPLRGGYYSPDRCHCHIRDQGYRFMYSAGMQECVGAPGLQA